MFGWANNILDGRLQELWESQKQKKKKEYGTLLELAKPLRLAHSCNGRFREERKEEEKRKREKKSNDPTSAKVKVLEAPSSIQTAGS